MHTNPDKGQTHHHVIHFSVDGEEFETQQREWTPNTIIKEFGGRDPATNYLVEIEGHHNISIGPTPVSDGSAQTGVALFLAGLKALGYKPVTLADKGDHVVFDYTVETGQFAGQHV